MADLEQEGLDHDTLQGKQGDDPEMLYVKQQPTDREKQAENVSTSHDKIQRKIVWLRLKFKPGDSTVRELSYGFKDDKSRDIKNAVQSAMRLLENMRTLIDDVPVSMKDRFSPFLSLIDTVHTLLSLEQDAQTLDSLEGVISSHVEELEEEFLRARGEL